VFKVGRWYRFRGHSTIGTKYKCVAVTSWGAALEVHKLGAATTPLTAVPHAHCPIPGAPPPWGGYYELDPTASVPYEPGQEGDLDSDI